MKPFVTVRAAFWGGLLSIAPILFGVVPFGLVYGVSATEIGLSPLEGLGMSLLLFAGAAQFVTVELLRTETSSWIILGSIAIVNLRFVVYSASLASYFSPYSSFWKTIASYVVTDEPYALSIAYFTEHPQAPHKLWYHLGHGSGLWLVWILSSAFGLLVGSVIPEEWSLEFANSLMFIGLLIPAITGPTLVVVGVVAGLVALMAAPLPHNIGFVLAVLCGIVVGVFLENRPMENK
ncbi:MAG: AzlC family ABC transporter permease [Chloroflexota bacterium]